MMAYVVYWAFPLFHLLTRKFNSSTSGKIFLNLSRVEIYMTRLEKPLFLLGSYLYSSLSIVRQAPGVLLEHIGHLDALVSQLGVPLKLLQLLLLLPGMNEGRI